MDEKGSKQVDVLDVQPAAAAREQIAAAVFEWQLGIHKTMLARFLPPIKISVEVPLCIVEHQTSPARVVLVFRKGCREVSQSVAPQRVRPQIEAYRQQCRTTSAKSPWRAYLDLDFRVTEKRRSNKVLDTLKKEYRRTSTAYRGQHKTQRGVGVLVVVDIENFLRSSKTFHQSRELTPVAQTVDFESHCRTAGWARVTDTQRAALRAFNELRSADAPLQIERTYFLLHYVRMERLS